MTLKCSQFSSQLTDASLTGTNFPAKQSAKHPPRFKSTQVELCTEPPWTEAEDERATRERVGISCNTRECREAADGGSRFASRP